MGNKITDRKIVLSLDGQLMLRVEKYAADHHITLDGLIEDLLNKVTAEESALENIPMSAWVSELAKGPATYGVKRSRKASKKSFYESQR